MSQVWKDQDRRADFFRRLEDLISDFPEIHSHRPDPCECGEDHGDEGFDPESPKMLTGLVLVVNYRNMDHWEEILTLDPLMQSAYLTLGLLTAAQDDVLSTV